MGFCSIRGHRAGAQYRPPSRQNGMRSHHRPPPPHARSARVAGAAPPAHTKPAAVVLVSLATGIGYFRYPGGVPANQRAPYSAEGTGGSHANASSPCPALIYAGSRLNSNPSRHCCQCSSLKRSCAPGDAHYCPRISEELGPPGFLERLQGCTSAVRPAALRTGIAPGALTWV